MLALSLSLGFSGMTKAAGELVIKLHYHRNDGNYDKWDAWLWEYGKDGKAYAFADELGEKVATMTVTPGTTQVGFIIRTDGWGSKDISEDQYIDLSEMISGTIHVYVESGVKGYTAEYGEDALLGLKLSNAKYLDEHKIAVELTAKLDGDVKNAFKVFQGSNELSLEDVFASGAKGYNIVIKEELDRYKSYFVEFDGVRYPVAIPTLYSTKEFEDKFTFNGWLGAEWGKDETCFRVWAPTAENAYVNLYKTGNEENNDLIKTYEMQRIENGAWECKINGDLNGVYYTYSVVIGDKKNEAVDPYAKTTGVNGKRGMVIDMKSTNPSGWDNDKDPNYDLNMTDCIIYELHVRDLSTHESSNIKNVGKYLGLTETNTKTSGGISTGLDHIKELGVTHLHILPFYDFGSIDETKLSENNFNWGYDPVNFNVPEGSYSTDPYNGEVRVKEVKEMVKALHDNGISVVMDVVYNHVYSGADFCFNKLVPGYFSRISDNGTYSNGSGCGNDTASERSMVHKYIVDSVNYWADNYHIDGFRFDLVGLIDIDTINEVVKTVHEKHPNVKFYGEGWTMSTNMTKDGYLLTTQKNADLVPDFAFFSDNIRDGLKGSVFSETDKGYVSGKNGQDSLIEKCYMGFSGGWSKEPSQQIVYASCHDNNTLYDRIKLSTNGDIDKNRIKMNNLAAAIYLTSQGTPFMQAGEEFLRSKVLPAGGFDNNSYASPDSVNRLKWSNLEESKYMQTFEYYKGLIEFRKAHPALRLVSSEEIKNSITRIKQEDDNVIVMLNQSKTAGEASEGIISIFNPTKEAVKVTLPEGEWIICVNDQFAGNEGLAKVTGEVEVNKISACILVKGGVEMKKENPANTEEIKAENANPALEENTEMAENKESSDFRSKLSWVFLGIGCVLLAVAAFFIFKKRKH